MFLHYVLCWCNYKQGKMIFKTIHFHFQVWPFSFQQHIDNKQLATVSLNQWLSRGDTNDIYLHTQSSATKNINNFMSNSSAHGWGEESQTLFFSLNHFILYRVFMIKDLLFKFTLYPFFMLTYSQNWKIIFQFQLQTVNLKFWLFFMKIVPFLTLFLVIQVR